MKKFELEVKKQGQTYICSNFEIVKKIITDGVAKYKDKVYTDSNEAKKDKEVLETIKEQIENTLDEIKKPYTDIEKQLDILLKLVKEPITNINKYEKQLKQETLRTKI